MLRLYITGSSINIENNNITVWDYLTYEPIAFFDLSIKGNINKAKKDITTFLAYSDEDYIRMLLEKGIKANRFTSDRVKDSEEWIKGAWMSLTNTVLNHFKIKGANEPIKNIKEILEDIQNNKTIENTNKNVYNKDISNGLIKTSREALKDTVKPKEIINHTPTKRVKRRLKKRLK